MKIGIVSDIHCDVEAFERALEEMGPVDLLMGAGDWVLQYRFSNQIYDMIRDYNIIAVRGNHDMAIASSAGAALRASGKITPEHLQRLDDMPSVVEVHVEGKRLVMMHTSRLDPTGGGRDLGGAALGKVVHHYVYNGGSYGRVPYEEIAEQALIPETYVIPKNANPTANTANGEIFIVAQDDGFQTTTLGDLPELKTDVLIVGHTHQPVVAEQGSRLVINPGSLGQPRNPAFPHRRTYMILDTKDWSPRMGEFQQAVYDEI